MNYSAWIYLFFMAGFVCKQVHILMPVISRSSPSLIIATKGSSVLLYWNYTYAGDGRHGSVSLTYKEQIIGFSNRIGTLKALAKRSGQDGVLTLESPVPPPFNGRVQVISSNSTLVIHDLHYDDASYKFSSCVSVDADVGAGPKSNMFDLLPTVVITVYGTPSFRRELPRHLDINESSNLLLELNMAGNPQPRIYFKWSHLHQEWSTMHISFQLLPILYIANYKLSNIDGSYCGRTLQFALKNSFGSVKKSTTVTVRLKLDRPFNLQARKIAASNCVEVKWKKVDSGTCTVKYAVVLKGASGKELYSNTKENIAKSRICNISVYTKVTDAQLTVSFKDALKFVTVKVSEGPIATSATATTAFVYRQLRILSSIEAKSSPSHIIATKGSSVWLHWNYTYFGDGMHGPVSYKFREQVIGFNVPSQRMTQIIARRIGQNGVLKLETLVPALFTGRVEVISSNNTLVIHDLQYNDSTCQFSSIVTVDADVGAGPKPNKFPISHQVKITVHGAPHFIRQPPTILEVNEGSTMLLKFYVDGNPKPSAYFKWPHLSQAWSEIFPIVQLHPFVYFSIYKLKNIDGSYCGRELLTKINSDIGLSSLIKSTYVTVKLKLDRPFDLQARKIAASNCVEVMWKKVKSGACNVRYAVALKGASGKVLYNKTNTNIEKRSICKISVYTKVTEAQLTVSFKNLSKVVTVQVSEEPSTTSDPTLTDTMNPSKKLTSGTDLPLLKPTSHKNPASILKPFKISHGPIFISKSNSYTGVIPGISTGAPLIFLVIIISIWLCIKKFRRRMKDDDRRHHAHYLRAERTEDDDRVSLRTFEEQQEDEVAHEIPRGQWLLGIKNAMVGLIHRKSRQLAMGAPANPCGNRN